MNITHTQVYNKDVFMKDIYIYIYYTPYICVHVYIYVYIHT